MSEKRGAAAGGHPHKEPPQHSMPPERLAARRNSQEIPVGIPTALGDEGTDVTGLIGLDPRRVRARAAAFPARRAAAAAAAAA